MEPITRPTTPRPVMDIRPARPAPTQPLQRTSFAVVEPAPMATPTLEVQPQLPPQSEEHQEVSQTPEIFPAKLPKVKTPVAAIVIALLVGGGLIGLTIFGYMKTQDKENVATPDTTTSETVTADDVNSTVTTTDEALEALDDTADFNEADFSDDALGL